MFWHQVRLFIKHLDDGWMSCVREPYNDNCLHYVDKIVEYNILSIHHLPIMTANQIGIIWYALYYSTDHLLLSERASHRCLGIQQLFQRERAFWCSEIIPNSVWTAFCGCCSSQQLITLLFCCCSQLLGQTGNVLIQIYCSCYIDYWQPQCQMPWPNISRYLTNVSL